METKDRIESKTNEGLGSDLQPLCLSTILTMPEMKILVASIIMGYCYLLLGLLDLLNITAL